MGGEVWDPAQGHNATVAWLKLGGRRIDSADNYDSQSGIGTGWIASGIPRADIFITSKVSTYTYNVTMAAFGGALKALQTDYVGLLLVHAPGSQPTVHGPYPPCREGKLGWTDCRIETWRAFETIFNQGRVRIQ